MTKDLTPDYLVSFLYNETSLSESAKIQNAISLDATLSAEYDAIKSAFQRLPKAQFRPSAKAIQNILRYSQQSEVTI